MSKFIHANDFWDVQCQFYDTALANIYIIETLMWSDTTGKQA